MRKCRLALFALLTLFLACTTDAEYSIWPCRFAYDNSIHLDQTLASALNSQSRGVFCLISERLLQGRKSLVFTNSNGMTSSQPETAIESQNRFQLGLSNGIIVGFQTFNTSPNGGFAAYDAQCPNCVRAHANKADARYQLTLDSRGFASCPACQRRYQLNNSGVVENGKQGDRKLEQYANAFTSGPSGMVTVFSK